MDLTVAICTAGRPRPCAEAVGDVLAQLSTDGECLVIDQSSPADHRALRVALPDDPRLTLVWSSVRELPHARNLALARAAGQRIVYFDDDVRLQPDALPRLAGALVPGVDGVVARIRERRLRPNRPPVINRVGPGGRVLTNLDGVGRQPIDSLKGCAMGFSVPALRAVGGFDRRFAGTAFLEDADASERVRRAGGGLRFVGEAVVDHLSAPRGGVRMPAAVHQWWRFHNTGLFVATHRGARGVVRGRLTFLAIAGRLALRWRSARALPALMEAFEAGVRRASSPPALLSANLDVSYNGRPETR